jgi:hypothetical protein
MRDKREKEQLLREEHKQRLLEAKARRKGEPILDRKKPFIEEKPTLLIVCEGQNTEPSYFRQFRLTSAKIIPLGIGSNTISLVNKTADLSKEYKYDQIWCVFDKDDFSSHDFNNAISTAEAQGIKVAYSNQAFEYWLILHLENHQGGGMHRRQYNDKINESLKEYGLTYDGNGTKIITEDLFEFLESIDPKYQKTRQELAIERAKRIFEPLDKTSPANEESSTTVFKLVEEIVKYR